MKEVYSIGEQEPWRLTKDSGYRLAMAVCSTGAEIIAASIDTNCPPTHANVRVRIDEQKVLAFQNHFKDSLEAVEIATGQ